jgi:TolB-like protein
LSSDEALRFGSFALDVRSHELRDGTRRIRLQEQSFEILRLMLERPGDIVARDEIRQRLWPDGTYVDFEHSLNAAVRRLRIALGDDAAHPEFVETVPRRGYRFIAARHDHASPAISRRTAVSPRRLVVLPFSTLSEDSSQEYFSDGLTEELMVRLGSVCPSEVAIIARSSSMFFKGVPRRAADICEALHADYLLEGSTRSEGALVRITARLVDAATEAQLWSEIYDRTVSDCLAVQADVAGCVAESLRQALLPDGCPDMVLPDTQVTHDSGHMGDTLPAHAPRSRRPRLRPDDPLTRSNCEAA